MEEVEPLDCSHCQRGRRRGTVPVFETKESWVTLAVRRNLWNMYYMIAMLLQIERRVCYIIIL